MKHFKKQIFIFLMIPFICLSQSESIEGSFDFDRYEEIPNADLISISGMMITTIDAIRHSEDTNVSVDANVSATVNGKKVKFSGAKLGELKTFDLLFLEEDESLCKKIQEHLKSHLKKYNFEEIFRLNKEKKPYNHSHFAWK